MKIAFIVAIAVATGYTAYSQSQKTEILSDLALENVEALASGEESGGSSVTVECPGGGIECARIIRGNEVHLFYKVGE